MTDTLPCLQSHLHSPKLKTQEEEEVCSWGEWRWLCKQGTDTQDLLFYFLFAQNGRLFIYKKNARRVDKRREAAPSLPPTLSPLQNLIGLCFCLFVCLFVWDFSNWICDWGCIFLGLHQNEKRRELRRVLLGAFLIPKWAEYYSSYCAAEGGLNRIILKTVYSEERMQ